MNKINIDERVIKAKNLLNNGFNCAQTIYITYSDILNIDEKLIARGTACFGGGIINLKGTCSAVTSMSSIVSMMHDASNPKDILQKTRVYETVNDVIEIFKLKHGSINCKELTEIENKSRNINCNNIVINTTRIIGKYINKTSDK